MAYDIITGTSTAEKLASRLNGQTDTKAALNMVKREDFPDDTSYLTAATKAYLERSDPAFAKAYSSIAAEYQKQTEEQQIARNRERYAELSKTVQLDDFERKEVERQARAAAERDLAAKRITLDGMGKAIAAHAEKFTAKAKEEKIGRVMMNEQLRAAMGR